MIDLAAYERLQADVKALPETIHAAIGRNDRVADVGGVAWHEAPIPPRWHRCRTQTSAHLPKGFVRRCACGAISIDGAGWSGRNSRRRGR